MKLKLRRNDGKKLKTFGMIKTHHPLVVGDLRCSFRINGNNFLAKKKKERNSMFQLSLNDADAQRITELAKQRGYETPEAYLLDLVAADTEPADEPLDVIFGEDFKQAFKDAVRGKFYTREEYERLIADDE